MYTVNGSNIAITKNNSGELVITPYIQDSDTEYILTGTDKLILTAKLYDKSKDFLIKKELTAEDYDEQHKLIFRFIPTDTSNLEPYKYCYDVVLYTSDGDFYTIIDLSSFTVLPSVTDYPVEEAGGT